jgi:hypothetical protein
MSSYKCVRLLVVIAICFIPAVAQRKAGDLKIKPYVFENGKGEKVDAELGTLLVPENRSDSQSNLIELAFVRFKSTARNPGPPIVYLAGGPGGSGSGAATGSRFPGPASHHALAAVMALFWFGSTLLYRGYTIEDLAANASFEEVVYLLWFGKLPAKAPFCNRVAPAIYVNSGASTTSC